MPKNHGVDKRTSHHPIVGSTVGTRIDKEKALELAYNGSNNKDISRIVGCDDLTLKKHLGKELDAKRAERRAALLKKQFDLALKGNPTMLIWLGKQELDQHEPKTAIEHSGEVKTNDPLIVRVVHVTDGDPGNGNGGNGNPK